MPLKFEKFNNLLTVLHLLTSFHLNPHLFKHVCRLVQRLDLAVAQERLCQSLMRVGDLWLWMREPGWKLFSIGLVVFWCAFNATLVLVRCYAWGSDDLELAFASTIMGEFHWVLLSLMRLLRFITSLGQKVDLNIVWYVFAHVFGSVVMLYGCHSRDFSLLYRFHCEVSLRCCLTAGAHQIG